MRREAKTSIGYEYVGEYHSVLKRKFSTISLFK